METCKYDKTFQDVRDTNENNNVGLRYKTKMHVEKGHKKKSKPQEQRN